MSSAIKEEEPVEHELHLPINNAGSPDRSIDQYWNFTAIIIQVHTEINLPITKGIYIVYSSLFLNGKPYKSTIQETT